jgi:hypothetical protein
MEEKSSCSMHGREIIMLNAWKRNHHAQCMEEESSCSMHGRGIIMLDAWRKRHDREYLA